MATAARTMLRSTASVTRRTAARVASASKPRTAGSPFSSGTQNTLSARIFRSPVELTCVSVQSMLPYYSVTASASMLSSNPRTFGWTLEGFSRSYNGRPDISESLGLPILGNVGMRLIGVKPKEELPLPSSMLFRNFEHSGNSEDPERKGFPSPGYPNAPQIEGFSRLGNSPRTGFPDVPRMEGSPRNGIFEYPGDPKSAETDGRSRPVDYVRGLLEDEKPRFNNGPLYSRYGSQYSRFTNVEQNADVVHIKILKNNTFVTLTDSKGNRKAGSNVSVSAGALPDKAGKNSRLFADATAEHVGRKARDLGIKSVVVKVDGYTLFKKKRQAIMSFKEGYNHSRGNQNPVVYIEDTTRRPHNGCRKRKQRRI